MEYLFRAWDKVDKRYIKPYHLCFMHGKNYYDDGHFVCVMGCDGNLYPKDRIILMQFTGLLDKNKKRIFEKDIIRRYSSPRDYNIDRLCCVEFKYGSFLFVPITDNADSLNHTYRQTTGYCSSIEIIGNSLDNPNLLNEVK